MNLKEIEACVIATKERFKSIRSRHPALRAYLVYSSRFGQTNISGSPETMLLEFPEMFLDSEEKAAALSKYALMVEELGESKVLDHHDFKSFQASIQLLPLDPSLEIEIRFEELDFDVVRKLKQDQDIDQKLSPETAASIKISLGRIGKNSN